MRCKILFIIPTMDRCGAEKQLTLLATRLPKEDFEVKVVLLTRGGPYLQTLLNAGISVELVGKKSKLSFRAYRKLKGVIKCFKPDIVHTWLFAAMITIILIIQGISQVKIIFCRGPYNINKKVSWLNHRLLIWTPPHSELHGIHLLYPPQNTCVTCRLYWSSGRSRSPGCGGDMIPSL